MAQIKELRPILLRGLAGSNPLGALAAFGLLRVCGDIPELFCTQLGWRMEDDWLAVLMVPEGVEKDQLIDLIIKWQQGWSADVIHWNDDIRSDPSDYKKKLIEYAQRASQGERHLADFFSAFGSETVTDGSKGLVKPTMFHMTSGQQKFLKNVREISDSLQKGADSALHETLYGPWRYTDQYHSLGWDPAAERLYALRHRAPTSEPARCVRAAVWLGFHALPLFPTVHRNRKLATSGFTFSNGETSLIWPIWTSPVTLEGMRSLLTCSELAAGPSGWQRLHRRGVEAVYRSVRSEFGQGYATLRPAQLVFSAV